MFGHKYGWKENEKTKAKRGKFTSINLLLRQIFHKVNDWGRLWRHCHRLGRLLLGALKSRQRFIIRRIEVCDGGSQWRAGPSLSSASAGLQPGHKLLGRLVLQVGAHVTGVGAVCVASEQTPAASIIWENNLNSSSPQSQIHFFSIRSTLTRFSWSSLATGQSLALSSSPGICCSRWKRFPRSVSSWWAVRRVRTTPSFHWVAWKWEKTHEAAFHSH